MAARFIYKFETYKINTDVFCLMFWCIYSKDAKITEHLCQKLEAFDENLSHFSIS